MKNILRSKYTYSILSGIFLSVVFYLIGANVVFRSPVLINVQFQSPAVWRYPKQEKAPVKPVQPPKKQTSLIPVAEAAGRDIRTRSLEYLSKYYKGQELDAMDTLIQKESKYDVGAINSSSGACGIPQSLPCSKMQCSLDEAGLECQLQWMVGYINKRYGSPIHALNFHLSNNWY